MMQIFFTVLILSLSCFVLIVSAQEEDDNSNSNYVNVHNHPKSSFSCVGKKAGEYYADPITNCQLYFVCLPNAHLTLSATSFACPNTTRFNQATRVCSPENQVYCKIAERYYENIHGNIDSKDHKVNEYLSNFDTTPWQINSKKSNKPSLIVPIGPVLEPSQNFKPNQPVERPRITVPKSSSNLDINSNKNNQPTFTLQPGRSSSRTRTNTRKVTENVSTFSPILSNKFEPAINTQSNTRLRLPNYFLPARGNNNNFANHPTVSTTIATTPSTTTTTTTTTVSPSPVNNAQPNKPNTDYIYDYVEYDQPGAPDQPVPTKPKLPSIPSIPSLDETTASPVNQPSIHNLNPVSNSNSNIGTFFSSTINHQPENIRTLSRPPQRNQLSSNSNSNQLNYFNSNPFVGNPFSNNPFVSNPFSSNGNVNTRLKRELLVDLEKEEMIKENENQTKKINLEQPIEEDEFNCYDKLPGIGYADISSKCKMFHICLPIIKGKYKDYQLFCESGSGYNQYTASCESLEKFDCKKSKNFYLYNKKVNLDGYMKNKYRINKQLSDIKN